MTSTNDAPAHYDEDGVSKRLSDAGERVVKLKADAMRGVGNRLEALAAMMQRHPLLSIAIGLGAGYLVARIIHRG
jgi:hypothetical protein